MKKMLAALATLAVVIASGCGGISPLTESNPPGNSAQVEQAPVYVEKVHLDASLLDLNVNQTARLTATVSPPNATEANLEWTSSAPAVAAVSSTGEITALGNGSAKITAAASGGETASATVVVTTPVEEVRINAAKLGLLIEETRQLTATVFPESASDKAVTWSSSNSAVADVNSAGQVTAQGNGSAEITATTRDGGKTASVSVTVTTPVTGISLPKTALSMEVGETTRLSAVISPSSASDKEVTWTSSNSAAAAVDSSGLISAKGQGTAIITVKARDGGKTAAVKVTVTKAPETGSADEMLMLSLVNQERQQAGLQPLKFNMQLTRVARIKSQDMIDNAYFSHTSPVYGSPFEMMDQFGISYRYAAENLALHPSVESAHLGLMNSEGHRANILHPSLTEIGIGILKNSKGQYYITQMFIGY